MSDESLVSAAEVARLADVGRAAVSNWRRRHPDFPQPVDSSEANPRFKRGEVEQWLREQGKLSAPDPVEAVWRALEAGRGDAEMSQLVAHVIAHLHGSGTASELGGHVRGLLDQVPDGERAELAEELFRRYFERSHRADVVTAPELAALMIELAGTLESVLDPACGGGAVLREAAARGARDLAGQELSEPLARLARARVEANAAPQATVRVTAGDSLRADAFGDLRADAVVCDPPFGYRDWGYEDLGVDPRWEYGFPVKNEPELAWLQHCLFHTRPGGTVVMLAPAGVASRRSGKVIRQAMVRRGVVRAVIALPPGLLRHTGIPVHLWVLRASEGDSAEPILLVDAGDAKPSRRGSVDWSALRATVLEPWQEFSDTGEVETIPGRQATVEPIDFLDEDVDLTPARHLPVPVTEVDAASLDSARKQLDAAVERLPGQLPRVRDSGAAWTRPSATIGDLVRAGAVLFRQQTGRVELTDEPGAGGRLVLTGRDLAAGTGPSMRADEERTGDLMELRAGDVVVPTLVAGDRRPTAEVVTETGLLLGPNVQLLRVDPERVDAEFLAGHLRAARAGRSGGVTASGVHRLDVRRVEVPVVEIDEQRRLGERFRVLRAFERELRSAADRGVELARRYTDGLAEGVIEPDYE
ncbi:N-6 DNA Methylase [Haloechinothrix alba]|uniref:N-6 DNA Methylase n=1 Tax=Haloechinothrix alba TaxID=664784 RepID=A0A238X2C9_9PSEU|nr:N-6 DNA methylase [Haloechinothrix alba]SNR52811.1 N-6 DNA Methylase [Haloechinothrix alba]